MRFPRKGIQFYLAEILQRHADTQCPVWKCSAEHEDAFWKALLGLDSGREGHNSGVWPSSRWRLLRVPRCLRSPETLGQVGLKCLGRTGSPLGLVHLGGTRVQEVGRVGWAQEREREALWTTTPLRRGAVRGSGYVLRAGSMENMGRVSLERCPNAHLQNEPVLVGAGRIIRRSSPLHVSKLKGNGLQLSLKVALRVFPGLSSPWRTCGLGTHTVLLRGGLTSHCAPHPAAGLTWLGLQKSLPLCPSPTVPAPHPPQGL